MRKSFVSRAAELIELCEDYTVVSMYAETLDVIKVDRTDYINTVCGRYRPVNLNKARQQSEQQCAFISSFLEFLKRMLQEFKKAGDKRSL